MAIELYQPAATDAPILGQIIFEAFGDLYRQHGLVTDFPNVDAATMLAKAFIEHPKYYSVAARDGGEVIGVNFASLTDEVAGIGPLAVRPGVQRRGMGRLLMQDVIDYSLKAHGPKVRLLQDGINVASLSLYTALGFDVREPIVMLTLAPLEETPAGVRKMRLDDIEPCDAICRRVYHISRKNELADLVRFGEAMGTNAFIMETAGEIRAYAAPGLMGHGVAASDEDLLTLLRVAAKPLAKEHRIFLCPARDARLYRLALLSGSRAMRTLHLMTMGPYAEPAGAWSPSIAF